MCSFDGPEGASHDICGSYNTLRAQKQTPTSNYKTQNSFANYSTTSTFANYQR